MSCLKLREKNDYLQKRTVILQTAKLCFTSVYDTDDCLSFRVSVVRQLIRFLKVIQISLKQDQVEVYTAESRINCGTKSYMYVSTSNWWVETFCRQFIIISTCVTIQPQSIHFKFYKIQLM